MKKILFILILCIGLCGCNNSQKLNNDIIQFSKLRIEDEHIVGQIKNKDDYKAYDVSIWFTLKNGEIEEKVKNSRKLEIQLLDVNYTVGEFGTILEYLDKAYSSLTGIIPSENIEH